ncbi:MAG: hypothetical protein LUI09_03935, partial [Prevotellaceae bacterium]|nr:hypothetical protein [Prevotellaceae bacterium]
AIEKLRFPLLIALACTNLAFSEVKARFASKAFLIGELPARWRQTQLKSSAFLCLLLSLALTLHRILRLLGLRSRLPPTILQRLKLKQSTYER